MTNKPHIKLVGEDGNIFNLVNIAQKALKKAGQYDEATELGKKLWSMESYDKAIQLIMNYCEVE
jgi:hypothetical protein